MYCIEETGSSHVLAMLLEDNFSLFPTVPAKIKKISIFKISNFYKTINKLHNHLERKTVVEIFDSCILLFEQGDKANIIQLILFKLNFVVCVIYRCYIYNASGATLLDIILL